MSANLEFPSRQRGVALAVVLILLVVMTLLGLAAMRGTLMEERMSASQRDRSLSFQAAEAALREAELVAAGKPTVPTTGCTGGVCATPLPTDTSRWLDTDTNWTAMSVPVSVTNVGTLTATPRYIIELMATDVPSTDCTTSGDVSPDAQCAETEDRYRVTVRSQQANRAEVLLQSNYAAP